MSLTRRVGLGMLSVRASVITKSDAAIPIPCVQCGNCNNQLSEYGSFLYPASEIYADDKAHQSAQHGGRRAVPQRDRAAAFRNACRSRHSQDRRSARLHPFSLRGPHAVPPHAIPARRGMGSGARRSVQRRRFRCAPQGVFRFRDAGEGRPRQRAGEVFQSAVSAPGILRSAATWFFTARSKRIRTRINRWC